MRNLLKRSFSGIVYVLIFVTAILFSEFSYLALITVFGMLCIWEFSKIIEVKNLALYIIFPLTLFLLIQRQDSYATLGLLVITILSSVILLYQLFVTKIIKVSKDRGKIGLSIRYIIFSMCFLALLPFYGDAFHPYLMISILSIIWVNDSFAFLVGKNLGTRKLFPSVSPKKTVEGFIGGLIFALLASILISKLNTDFSTFEWAVIAALISCFGTMGDLIESKFKRQANLKDSGTIMPGHGGILDRLDSLLFAAPFVYLYINYLI